MRTAVVRRRLCANSLARPASHGTAAGRNLEPRAPRTRVNPSPEDAWVRVQLGSGARVSHPGPNPSSLQGQGGGRQLRTGGSGGPAASQLAIWNAGAHEKQAGTAAPRRSNIVFASWLPCAPHGKTRHHRWACDKWFKNRPHLRCHRMCRGKAVRHHSSGKSCSPDLVDPKHRRMGPETTKMSDTSREGRW